MEFTFPEKIVGGQKDNDCGKLEKYENSSVLMSQKSML